MNSALAWQALLPDTALKAALLLAVVWLVARLLFRLSAARRYMVWLSATLAAAALPLAAPLVPGWHILPSMGDLQPVMQELYAAVPEAAASAPPHPAADKTPQGAASMPAPSVAVSTAFPSGLPALPPPGPHPSMSDNEMLGAAAWLWLTVALALLARLGLGILLLRDLERRCTSLPDSAWPPGLTTPAAIAAELGLKNLPRLLIGPSQSVPMVWGLLRPCLLLPSSFVQWTPVQMRAVLLHELAHLRRRDPLALFAGQLMQALHWYNPLAWLTLRHLRADQERACDDTVLRHGIRASDYAGHLLSLSRHTRIAPGLGLCALAMARTAPVESRITAILDTRLKREGAGPRWSALLIALGLLAALPLAMVQAALESAKARGRILDRNGLVLAESTPEHIRRYPLKALTSHITGYTCLPDLGNPVGFGAAGLEKQQDTALAAGQDVKLTLDARVQQITRRVLAEGGVIRGAAVVLDPRSGDILAMVSLPDYDAGDFIPAVSKENWQRLLEDRDVPLLNRAVRGFAPGSSFKPVTALAAVAAGKGGEQFECTGAVTYGTKAMQCWIQRQGGGRHGLLNMRQALARSCNCYFYQLGNASGMDSITVIGRHLGLGESYSVLPEESGAMLPTPEWMAASRPKEKWTPGYTANTSIGQGSVLTTPLQMAVLAATVANGGRVPQPRLTSPQSPPAFRASLLREGLSAAAIEEIRLGMWDCVNGPGGTASNAVGKYVTAGKTGTAQHWRQIDGRKVADNHGWFIGFAPYDQPALAFAILCQGAKSGGGTCGPLARQIVEQTLDLPADGSGAVQPVKPEPGKP